VNLPNILSILRITLIPIFIAVFAAQSPGRSQWAALIFIMASLTDWFDGYIARRWEQVTLFGKFIDPVADKLLVLAALIMLVEFKRVDSWIAIVIIGRDLAITGLRAIASSMGIVIAAKEMGKYKTTVQIVAIILLILDYPIFIFERSFDLHYWGTVGIWLAAILSLISALEYFFRFWRHIKGQKLV